VDEEEEHLEYVSWVSGGWYPAAGRLVVGDCFARLAYDDSNNASTPLVLDFLLIRNGLPTASSVALTSASKKINVAGVVCGVLAVVVVLILAFFFLRYRKPKGIKFAPSSKFPVPIPFRHRPPPPVKESTSLSSLGLFFDLAAAPPTHRRRTSRAQQPEASGSQPSRLAAPRVPPKAVNDQTSY